MTSTEERPCLYEVTGDIKDFNTVLVQRNELKRLIKRSEMLRTTYRSALVLSAVILMLYLGVIAWK